MEPYFYLLIIPVLGLLIFVHELGHFVTARLSGIKVEEFGFGFPPRIFAIRRNGIDYSINAIPLGGFVRMLGENGDSSDPDSFGQKSPWRRMVVLTAGSLMNVALAVFLFALIAFAGDPTGAGVKVASVTPNAPAAVAGLQAGDILLDMNGQKLADVTQLQALTQENLGRDVTITVERDGKVVGPLHVTPRANPPEGQGAMGVVIQSARIEYIQHWPWEALWMGFERTAQVIILIIAGIAAIVQRIIPADFAGPIGIAQLTAEVAASAGGFWPAVISLLNLSAFLSVNLFILNLLPLPGLDGGRLIFVVIEAVRRGKRISPEKEGFVHFVGLMLLIAFVVVISYYDVLRAFRGETLLK